MTSTLRVAVVGAGPAGLYVTDGLIYQERHPVQVDVYDRLPTPFGLLRYGVAPDHLKMKSLARALQRTLDDPRVRLLGNVDVGRDVTVDELRAGYHAVCYCFGAATDKRLEVPGEDLPGSESATDFVTWYSGHPDVPPDRFPLTAETVVVVGVGNVAIDVARILVKDVDVLSSTDLPPHVIDVLRDSVVRDVHLLGRRGPLHAKFTNKELRELGELEGVDIVVDPAALELTLQEQQLLQEHPALQRNLDLLVEWSARPPSGAARRLHLHFWKRPVALHGDGHVTSVLVEPTRLDEDGRLVGAGQPEPLTAQLVLRSVGYRGTAIPGLPLDEASCTIPSEQGRVLRAGRTSPGEYVAGWIGRGPVGVLGTNKADAEAVVERMLADLVDPRPPVTGPDPVALLAERGVDVVDGEGWSRIDTAEVVRGSGLGRPRTKLATWDELLGASRAH